MARRRILAVVLSATALCAARLPAQAPSRSEESNLSSQVEILRTQYDVPHIRARNLKAAFFALAYVQCEDYGSRVPMGLLRERGQMGKVFGRDSMEGDFAARPGFERAIQVYRELEQDTRDAYDGFAAGVNRYIEKHPAEFPAGFRPMFTGYDVLARDIDGPSAQAARRFLLKNDPNTQRIRQTRADVSSSEGDQDPSNVGSNAWAFAPGRTKSGRAILLRNPHLNWNSGYYEAQMTVPGKFDFYGDFRIGGPFSAIGGFNQYLGWSTTNNAPDLDEVYSLDVAPGTTDRYIFEGTTVPLTRELRTVEYRNGDGFSTETREFWTTPLGPVIMRDAGKIYIVRTAAEGGFRHGEQFLHMMRAHSLAEWKDAMRMRARVTSNFTYADRAGNIFYLWNAALPSRPHLQGGDTIAVPAHRTADVFTHYVPFDSLPQVLNPPGGYVHNENNAPFYTNMNLVLDTANFPADVERPSLSLRAQLAIQLVSGKEKLSLDDVIRMKHSYRMLLADRVKDDLIAAVRGVSENAAPVSADAMKAIEVLERWHNDAAEDSRGAVLFETWFRRYAPDSARAPIFAHPWTPADPVRTPAGLADPSRARAAFEWAVAETIRRYGSADVAWGDVHRVRLGSVDVPVGGCGGATGCFRVLNFRPDSDGKLVANGGDGWILAVEFTDVPRAMSVLAYGESSRANSPHHSDQAALFARGELKPVHYTQAAVDRNVVRRYRPGEEQSQAVDVLIRGGTVVDGSGSAPRIEDVGVRGDRIVFVGDADSNGITAVKSLDATGMIVAPGFIDPHTHTAGDLSDSVRKSNVPYLMQGVTTVITNNDGGGTIQIGRLLDSWTKNGIGTNAAVYIGQGSVRGAVMGMSDGSPSAAQLDSMRAIVTRGMEQGAIGLSSGLYYAPGSYASTEEVIELARAAAAKGGRYDTHIRDESSYTVGLLGGINEAIRIGREAHLPVHISHIKALGADVWGQSDTVIALVKSARASGIDVTASQYPYTASGTSVGAALLPRWAEAGGRDSLRARIADPKTRARLTAEMQDNLRRRGGSASLLITGTRDTTIRGKRLDAVARERNTTPVEAAVQIVLAGDASVASFNMDERDIEKFMIQDFVMTDSDGSDGHPRKYGTFPKLIRTYVYDRHVLTLPQAVRRSSSMTAAFFGFVDRGTIKQGYFADLIVFDPKTIADRSTYENPTLLATGMKYVLVNGVVAVDNGRYSGATAGRVLKP